MKNQACFLFLNPQDEVGPSIFSLVVLCYFVLLVYIVVFFFGILFVSIEKNKSSHMECKGNCGEKGGITNRTVEKEN